MPTNNPISQNNDDYFYSAVCAYVRGKANGVLPGTVGEEQAEIAKRLFQDNPAILNDKDRLLAEIATINYRERGLEADEALWAERNKKHDDDLFAELVAYVRDQPHEIKPGTDYETWAKHAKQLAAEDPTILDHQQRLLTTVCCWWPLEEADLGRRAKHDDDLFAKLVAYVRDQPHEIKPGTYGETWAKHAKQLAAEDPTILDHQQRLLATVCGWSPPEDADLEPPGGWRAHNGRVDRNCISKAEYDRRMEERRAAGLLLDPSTAEITWNYAETLDPYGDGLPLLPQEQQIGREYFARSPDSDIRVSDGDLPDATRDAIWKRFENKGRDPKNRH